MKVLCIDDEPLALRLLVSILKDQPGIEVLHSFSSADEALAGAKTTAYDIAFVDIMLGDSNGLDLAQSMRSIQPSCKIIYCTGHPQYAIESINRGIVDGYLMKPIDEGQLRDLLDRYRSRKPLKISGRVPQLHILDRYGKPVVFKRKKTIQFFSFLLEREGKDATADELCEYLWEHKAEMIYKNRQYLYSITHDLNTTLKEHDASEVFVRTAEGYALDMSEIEIE